jgi:anthranilate/para-aminobenzoate synthase component I
VGAIRQLSSAREAEKRWYYSSVVGYSPDSNNMNTEAEEFLLLRAVTKQQLARTLQAGED